MTEWLNSLRHRLRALVRQRQLERDLHDELTFHLAMREEQLRTAGASDAGAGARRRFGSVTRIREDLRDTWALAPRGRGLLRDLRYAARMLRRDVAFTSVVVLTLGLGIGANTAFFSVVSAVLIRPLGFADAERLVAIHEGFPSAGIDRLPFSALDFEDLRSHQRSFAVVAAYRNVPFEISGVGTPERIVGARVAPELFDALGVAPMAGRRFSSADDRPGVNVAIVSWGLWQRRYAASPSIIGQNLQLDRQQYTVVGVMPAGFVFPRRGTPFNGQPADVWVPLAFTDRERGERGSLQTNSVIARLKPGVPFQAAEADLRAVAQRIAANYPIGVRNAGFSPRLFAQPFREELSGHLASPLLMLLAAVGLVLLIACANVANLVLSRAATRTHEFAIRTALGARRSQLAGMLLCEALLLSAAGGIAGIAIAFWAVKSAPAVLTRTIPGLHVLSIDFPVLAFTGLTCLATTIVVGLVPLAALDRRRPGDALREGSARTTSGLSTLHVQRGFVVLTVGLACVLLVGAGLFIRSFATLVATDTGFRSTQVLTAAMTLPPSVYTTAASVRAFHEALSEVLSALPGVRTVATATNLPLTTYELRAFTAEGAAPTGTVQPTTNLTWVHGPYFETLGMRLKHGRFFGPGEHAHPRRVVIINEKLAALAWPGEDAVGQRLKWGAAASQAPWLTVVGVIENVADGPIGAEPKFHAYEPFRQIPDSFLNGAPNQFGRDLTAAILADGDPRALSALVRREVSNLDPALAIESLELMDDRVSELVAPQRFSMLLVTVFAAMALLLASVGLYGLLAFTAAQRQKEIAVRMALGAKRGAVVVMVIGEGARLVGIGLIAGVLGSFALIRVVGSLLYGTSLDNFLAFALIPALFVPATLTACALPAWRAARLDPHMALRAD